MSKETNISYDEEMHREHFTTSKEIKATSTTPVK